MVDQTIPADDAAAKPSKVPLILGVILALLGGSGGFYAVQSGWIDFTGSSQEAGREKAMETEDSFPDLPLPDVSFVEIPPLVVSLGPGSTGQHLKFRASLEVPKDHEAEITSIIPRIQDVLNGYLRALETKDLEAQGALIRLRSQMLRRVKLVTGEGRVSDLLVLEFVLN